MAAGGLLPLSWLFLVFLWWSWLPGGRCVSGTTVPMGRGCAAPPRQSEGRRMHGCDGSIRNMERWLHGVRSIPRGGVTGERQERAGAKAGETGRLCW